MNGNPAIAREGVAHISAYDNYRDILRVEFESRRTRNPGYSQRAFARDLGLGASRMSEVLRGKQGLSPSTAAKLGRGLRLPEVERTYFCNLVTRDHARNEAERKMTQKRIEQFRKLKEYHSIQLDTFKYISEWYHLAIIELTKLPSFQSSSRWIANALSISEEQVVVAIERLKRLRMLRVQEGALVLTSENNFLSGGVASEAVKRFHEQILGKAASAIRTQSVEEREMVTTMLAFDRPLLGEVRKRIQEFWTSIDREMGNRSQSTDLYCLSVQFFNLTGGKKDA